MPNLARQIARLSPEQRARLDRLKGEGATIPRRATPAVDLSFAQRRMWFLEQLAPGSAANNIVARWRIEGPIDAARLERALAVLVARHEVLRTRVVAVRGEP